MKKTLAEQFEIDADADAKSVRRRGRKHADAVPKPRDADDPVDDSGSDDEPYRDDFASLTDACEWTKETNSLEEDVVDEDAIAELDAFVFDEQPAESEDGVESVFEEMSEDEALAALEGIFATEEPEGAGVEAVRGVSKHAQAPEPAPDAADDAFEDLEAEASPLFEEAHEDAPDTDENDFEIFETVETGFDDVSDDEPALEDIETETSDEIPASRAVALAGAEDAEAAAAPEETAAPAHQDHAAVEVHDELDDGLYDRPVPRISIQAFCEREETSALIEQAANDRRLAKAHVTIQMGGAEKAVEFFQDTPTPHLILIETLDRPRKLIEKLGELASVCDPSTKVIITGDKNDISLYRELIRQGVSEYVVCPRTPLDIIKPISSIYVDPSAPPIGSTVAFVGARGGVGSSTLAHNVAWAISEEHHSDTILLDLDLPFGTASLDFECDPSQGLAEALSAPERLDDVLLDRLLQKCTERLSLFAAPNLLDREYAHDDQAFETVIDVVRSAAPTVVIDVPHMWTSWTKHILHTADQVVITATPDLAAFRNAKSLVEIVTAARPNDAPPILVLNQMDVPRRPEVPVQQFVENVGLAPTVTIGWDPQLFGAASTGATSLTEAGPRSKAAESIRAIATAVLGREAPASRKSVFSLQKLFRRQ